MEDQTQTKTKDKEASGSGLGKTMMSPYFLSASDNPGTIITQPADDSADLEDWWMVNSMLVSWIQNTIKPNMRSTVTNKEVAKLLWDAIKERFSVGNGPRVQQLKSELANCKQRGMTILNYCGKLKMLWEELSNYEQSPACLYGNCTCNLVAEWDKKRAVYGGVRSHILSTEPLPKLNHAYAIVIQEEQVQSMTRSHDNWDKSSILCTHCNKNGHEASSCFQLIGYPECWGERSKATRNASHGRDNSRQNSRNNGRGRGGPAWANAAQVATGSNNPSGELPESAASDLSGLNSEQWNILLNLLNSQKDNTSRISGKLNSMEWILDTGASHHMTGNRKILCDIVSVIPCSIRLPDGNTTIANKEGTVVLASLLRLNNVLFVPSLTCNLISVSQLI
ncbi:retrotran gag 3 domain-containing protein [Citrus sinensis]|uniref:Retrotran gag 3 domain-containing protein n=1 Tax=Citrus sinensis TaxID=2711 RepID=A0ACB8MVW8_CITSI|nr:retrotran gag 3 domain-containing protein [Citrus sinensis]